MSTLPDEIMTRLAIAAELRAAGATWAKVGEKCERNPETCRRWPREYRKVWLKLYSEAEGLAIRDAGTESRNSLRKCMQSKDERIIVKAAEILDRGAERQRVRDEKEFVETPEQYDAELAATIKLYRGLTEEELKQIVDRNFEEWLREKQEKAASEAELARQASQGAA